MLRSTVPPSPGLNFTFTVPLLQELIGTMTMISAPQKLVSQIINAYVIINYNPKS